MTIFLSVALEDSTSFFLELHHPIFTSLDFATFFVSEHGRQPYA
jgi:hypothetical protein